jgi:UTP--glucose-1-phosphate uridylyltransferase
MPKPPRKAVFPVGGLGTRFLPATKSVPKEMLPVVDKPLIQYAVEEARSAGIEHFIFVTGRGKSAIEDHFDIAFELQEMLGARGKTAEIDTVNGWLPRAGEVSYTRQPDASGLGHAVWCARHLVGDEPFVVVLPDDLIRAERPCLGQMLEAHAEVGGNMVAVMDVAPEHTARYGVVDPGRQQGRLIEVRGLVEKPDPAVAPSNYAVIGRYVLMPEVFEHLDRHERGAGGEIQITDALARMIGVAPFHGYLFEGERFDCGDRVGYLEANIRFALDRPDMRAELAPFIAAIAETL